MTPDRMVVDEARRTFTYLNLYGYLTDAVVVNRVFPEEVGDVLRRAGASASRSTCAPSQEALRARAGAAAPYFGEEVVGAAMLDRLGDALFAERDAGGRAARRRSARSSIVGADGATLRLDLPFADKGDIERQEARPRADRARRRPQAHAGAAARAGRLPSGGRRVRRRRPDGELRRDWPADPTLDDLRERMRADAGGRERAGGRRCRAQGWAHAREDARRDRPRDPGARRRSCSTLRELVPPELVGADPRASPPAAAARCARCSTGGSSASRAAARRAAPTPDGRRTSRSTETIGAIARPGSSPAPRRTSRRRVRTASR